MIQEPLTQNATLFGVIEAKTVIIVYMCVPRLFQGNFAVKVINAQMQRAVFRQL